MTSCAATNLEITVHHPLVSHANLGNIRIDEYSAVALYRYLLKLGATKDIKMVLTDGGILIHRKFKYRTAIIDEEGECPEHIGDQYYKLEEFLDILCRLVRRKNAQRNKHTKAMNLLRKAITELEDLP